MTPEEYAIYGLDATGRHRGGPRRWMRKVTVEQAQRVVDLHAAGVPRGDIGREVGLSRHPIWEILGGWHWTVREGHVRLPEREEAP